MSVADPVPGVLLLFLVLFLRATSGSWLGLSCGAALGCGRSESSGWAMPGCHSAMTGLRRGCGGAGCGVGGLTGAARAAGWAEGVAEGERETEGAFTSREGSSGTYKAEHQLIGRCSRHAAPGSAADTHEAREALRHWLQLGLASFVLLLEQAELLQAIERCCGLHSARL